MYQLSFVFQGKVIFDNEYKEIVDNITNVRALYPCSEIILSTWSTESEKEKVLREKLKPLAVKIVFSEDPGPLIFKDGNFKWISNINRMIFSSRKGIEISSRDYVVKLRTDTLFINHNLKSIFLNREWINKRYTREKEYSLFTERVINCNLFARHSRSYRPFDFHPGDIMLLGRKEDLLNLFSLPLADESIFNVVFNKSIFSLMHFVPEQYLWVNYIKNRKSDFTYLGNTQRTKMITSLSEKYYVNNFIPFNCKQLGFVWPKYILKYKGKGGGSIYQFLDWVKINNVYYKKTSDSKLYSQSYNIKIILIKLAYLFFYLPLRCRMIRRIIMELKSRE